MPTCSLVRSSFNRAGPRTGTRMGPSHCWAELRTRVLGRSSAVPVPVPPPPTSFSLPSFSKENLLLWVFAGPAYFPFPFHGLSALTNKYKMLGWFSFHFQTSAIPSLDSELPAARSSSAWHRPQQHIAVLQCSRCCAEGQHPPRRGQRVSRLWKMLPKSLSTLCTALHIINFLEKPALPSVLTNPGENCHFSTSFQAGIWPGHESL